MGADKKIGIEKSIRVIANRYANRYLFTSYNLVLSRSSGRRIIYFIGTDENDIIYRIRFAKVKKMKKPKGIQVLNRHAYLVLQAERVHGEGTYDYSLIKEEDITFSNKLDIVCKTHGVFKKRKAAHVTDKEGCPKCSAKKLKHQRKCLVKNNFN